jgi:acyl carrier protein
MRPTDTYADLMRQVRTRVKSGMSHGDLPQPTIMRCAGLVGPQARELTHRSIFQYWHAGLRDGLDVMNLRLAGPESEAVLSLLDVESTAGFTLAVMVRQDSEGTHVLWKDPAGVLGESVLSAMAADYHEVLWTIAEDPDAPLIEIVAEWDTAPSLADTARGGGDLDASLLVTMTEVWEEVLGIEDIDPKDSFFELGGHSLLAESLVIDVSRRFGYEVPLSVLFTWPRLAEFTEEVLRCRP